MTPDASAAEFTKLLDYLKASRGFDFGAYKVSSLMRRIQKRMHEVGVPGYGEYCDYLEVHPGEFGPLFDSVLINVTSFFRDAPAWAYLAETILPRIAEERLPDGPIRVWSAGCASGEEAYTLAMLLVETVGEVAFRQKVKIYATDVDESILAFARQGSFESRQVANLSPEHLDRYFERAGSRYVFRTDLRRCLIFGRHDLIQDAAISRLDLLVCRNTLMYFNSEAQERILARFHFALGRSGFLFLGKAETLLTHQNSFKPVDLRHRVFVRSLVSNTRDRLLALSNPGPGAPDAAGDPDGVNRHLRLRESVFDAGPVAQIAVDCNGYLVLANERARRLLKLSPTDLGRLLQDLELSYRPVELRSHIKEAYETRSPIQLEDVEWRGDGGELRHFEIQVTPLTDDTGGVLGVSVALLDLTQAHQLRSELQRANQELETAYEELQSSNEELETTNEELQSTVEELETTNEELQSANEELETMNEELQSTNEELHTLNDQLQARSEELNRVNGYFESVLSRLHAAVVVLDRSLHVKVWSEKAADLWGLRPDEVKDHNFLDLDIGLPVAELRQPLRDCLMGGVKKDLELDGINRRGKALRCHVRCTPFLGRMEGRTEIEGVILLLEETGHREG